MIYYALGLLVCLFVLWLLLFGTTKRDRLMKIGTDMAISSVKELDELSKLIVRISSDEFSIGSFASLNVMALAQAAFLQTTIGLIAAFGLRNPQPILEHLRRVAFDKDFDYNEYVFSVNRAVMVRVENEDEATKAEAKKLMDELRSLADIVMPLRRKLVTAFEKAGIEWTLQK